MPHARIWPLILLLLCAAPLAAQNAGVRYDNVAQANVAGVVRVIPNAPITVCTSAGAGIPCSPLAAIYSDAALTVPITQPGFTADANGNFGFYVAPGAYKYSIGASALAPGGALYAITPPSSVMISGAAVNLFTQAANISVTNIPGGPFVAGFYRVSCYVVETQAATTSSSLPNCTIGYTDNDTTTAESLTFSATNSANTVGLLGPLNATSLGYQPTIYIKASTNITYSTANYASVGGTSMQYAIHIRLEYLGP